MSNIKLFEHLKEIITSLETTTISLLLTEQERLQLDNELLLIAQSIQEVNIQLLQKSQPSKPKEVVKVRSLLSNFPKTQKKVEDGVKIIEYNLKSKPLTKFPEQLKSDTKENLKVPGRKIQFLLNNRAKKEDFCDDCQVRDPGETLFDEYSSQEKFQIGYESN
jgi:hypothetical protein